MNNAIPNERVAFHIQQMKNAVNNGSTATPSTPVPEVKPEAKKEERSGDNHTGGGQFKHIPPANEQDTRLGRQVLPLCDRD